VGHIVILVPEGDLVYRMGGRREGRGGERGRREKRREGEGGRLAPRS